MSKVDQAKAIYAANAGLPRKAVIELIQSTLQISPVSAATYYQTAKRAAIEAGEAAPAPKLEAKVEASEPVKAAVKATVERVYTPSRERIATSTRKTSLELYYESLSDEERATWSEDIARYAKE